MMKNYLVFGLVLTLVVSLSGCLSMDPETLAFANPLVKQFMSEYPNAQISATHYSAEESQQILEQISIDCGKEISQKEFYKINIDDPDSGLKVVTWVDIENLVIECAVKYGTGDEKTISKPGEPVKTCKSHAEAKCYGEHVYWFDSCGHVQEKKEYCQEGCELGFCKEEKKECESRAEYKCYEGHVYWFDSCGNAEEKKEECEYGCEGGVCTKLIIVTRTEGGGLGISPAKFEIYSEPGKKIEFLGTVKNEMDVSTEINLFDDGDLEEFGELSIEDVHLDPLGSAEFTYTLDLSEETEPGRHETILWAADPIEAQEDELAARLKVGMKIIVNVLLEEDCFDSDGGKDYYEKGTVTKGTQSLSDHCNEDWTLTEKYCENNEIKAETVECPDEYTCYNGKCNPENVSKCTPHYMYECHSGHVYWHNSCEIPEEIKEECDFLCYIDRCVSKNEVECEDTDDWSGERYIYNTGTVKIILKSTGNIIDFETDSCNSVSGILTEYYCEDNEIKSEEVNCTYGCGGTSPKYYGRCETEKIEAESLAECENGNLYHHLLNTGNRPLETSNIKVIEWTSEEEIAGSWDKSLINPEEYSMFESGSYLEGTSYRVIYYPNISEEYPACPLMGKKWPGVCREKVFIDTVTESGGQITMTGHISLNETDVSGSKTFSVTPFVSYWYLEGGKIVQQKEQSEFQLSVPITDFDLGTVYFEPTTDTITFSVEWSADYLEEHIYPGTETLFGGRVSLECTPDCDESEDSDLKKL